ncbi:MAG: hypothetical protein HYV27_06330 [Candidatus Hydrogenedentes bacterium]|nr:hypothetical protein [Candidatus Hydrogenedentota bacterium]
MTDGGAEEGGLPAVAARWGISRSEAEARAGDYAWLLEELSGRIQHLLCGNMDKLMRTLYVLDIPEERYQAAMGAATLAEKARRLAEAVLERETEKIAARERYARGGASLADHRHSRSEAPG